MIKLNRAESTLSIMVSILLSFILLLAYSKWQERQNSAEISLYQRLQAMQITENQIALKMANLPCESTLQQNQQHFQIRCGEDKIEVQYPLGIFKLTTKNF